MLRRSLIVSLVLAAGTLAAGVPLLSSLLGASAGEAVPFEPVPLPPVGVALPPGAAPAGVTPSAAGALAHLAPGGAFAPTLEQLLTGDTVIRTEAQMRLAWRQLFDAPYDPSLFDFDSSFVVLMGGGVVANGNFGISAVESAEATWASPYGPGGREESAPFLAVTATTFLSGVPPEDPATPVPLVSAVRIPAELDLDVLFHRTIIMGI